MPANALYAVPQTGKSKPFCWGRRDDAGAMRI